MATQTESSLRGHISDMKAATDHLVEAFTHQLADQGVQKNATLSALVQRLQTTAKSQSQRLEAELDRFGAPASDGVKGLVAAVAGTVAGLYDRMRSNTVSRMLRDDYTAMSLAVVSNSMLHVTALAADDPALAATALRNMEELAPLIIEVGEAILPVVELELSEEFTPRAGAASTALENVRSVWKK
ncbi:MAG: hypothetical protein J0I12_16055 [Candidatus Eremiobacteraeota bacterium]|nr:hypothetical protein [Candidatus Eremiobacteraeota bacterium]